MAIIQEEAQKKLAECLLKDYDFAQLIETEEEFIREKHGGLIEEHCYEIGVDFTSYFEQTKKRWMAYHKLTADSFNKFEKPGYYSNDSVGMIMAKDGESYEFDSRYYRIEEE